MKFFSLVLIAAVLFAFVPNQPQKQKYLYPLGEKIFKQECKKLSIKHFDTFEALCHYIHTHCHLDEERYEDALAWYVWDRKYLYRLSKEEIEFHYSKKDKCPVCGMFIYKYPKWASMAKTKEGRELYFDGVKDMMKYYFAHKNELKKLYAQDYYSKKIIELHRAWLVVGSDVYGPMGEEIIPFEKKEEAKSFMLDHHAKKIVTFKELDKRTMEAFDE